jgi:hypothetical protein
MFKVASYVLAALASTASARQQRFSEPEINLVGPREKWVQENNLSYA